MIFVSFGGQDLDRFCSLSKTQNHLFAMDGLDCMVCHCQHITLATSSIVYLLPKTCKQVLNPFRMYRLSDMSCLQMQFSLFTVL